MIEKRRIWTDWALADYIRDELGFPVARQGAMLEKERVDIATGEMSRERWYLLTSLSLRRCASKELLRGIRNHWSVENILHHVKDRSWDEDVHTLRRPGLGEVYASLVNTALNALRLEGRFPPPDVLAPASQDLRLPTIADHRPPPRSNLLTLQSSCMAGTANGARPSRGAILNQYQGGMCFGELDDDRKDSTAPHISFRPQLGGHR